MHRGPLQYDIAYNNAVTNVEYRFDFRHKKTPHIALVVQIALHILS